MKICILTTGYPTPQDPGRYAFVDQLACAWADMGNKVSVIYPVPAFVEIKNQKRFYKSKWERETPGHNTVSVRCPRFFSVSNRRLFGIDTQSISYKSFQRAVIKSINNMKEKPDVLYGHFLPSGCQAGDAGEKLSIPSFCAFGESSLWSIEGWDINTIRNRLAKLSGIISVSTENKRILVEQHLYREKDIKVFPNGADHSLFHPSDRKMMRKKYGFPEDAFIGVYTGAFNDDKGVLRAQEAAVHAGDTFMIYIGGGNLKPQGDNILFSGKLPHDIIPEYLSAADFFILPTRAEGCCNAIVEAISCGLPVISADRAYNNDILEESYSVRTDPEDIEAMTEAIISLRDNPERREQLSWAAKEKSVKFDVHKRASAILEFMRNKSGNRAENR